MPGPEPGGEFASARLRSVDVVTFRVNAGEEGMKPEEGEQRHGGEWREKPCAKVSGCDRVPFPFEGVEDRGERGESDLPLEKAQQDGLGDATGLAGWEGVLDLGSENHRDGNEGDAEARADPQRPEKEGEQTQHGLKGSTGWGSASSRRIEVNPFFCRGTLPGKLSLGMNG